MHDYRLRVYGGPEKLETDAAAWDDLWRRSYTRQPTVTAAAIKNWVHSFAPDKRFTAICVESDERLVAGIPLLRDDARGVCAVYKLPVNCWAGCGDLLLDSTLDAIPILDLLVDGIEQLRSPLLSLEEISVESPQWVALRQAVRRRGGRSFIASTRPVGVVDVLHDWDRYEKSWSGNHRGAVKRSYRKLAKQGDLKIERYRSISDRELVELMRLAFEIEDGGWKGDAGSSVLKTPGMLEYMIREARLVANLGCLDFWFLYFNDIPIAFEYCHFSGGTCFSHKIGYESEYARFGPGRLLRYMQLKEHHADPECELLDTLGTLCESKAKWATRTYQVGRMHVSVGSPWISLLLRGYAWAHPRLRTIRGEVAAPVPKVGAAGTLRDTAEQQMAT